METGGQGQGQGRASRSDSVPPPDPYMPDRLVSSASWSRLVEEEQPTPQQHLGSSVPARPQPLPVLEQRAVKDYEVHLRCRDVIKTKGSQLVAVVYAKDTKTNDWRFISKTEYVKKSAQPNFVTALKLPDSLLPHHDFGDVRTVYATMLP